ncbi:MAG: hypothetical protein IJX85_12710 [Lachnospiraceae bacterium]|nr:hypothetical protein [Lachnospiraceae bacterium]
MALAELRNIFQPKHKKCRAKLVWDDIKYTFDLVVWNSGEKSIVINYVELFYVSMLKKVSLGVRENFYNVNNESNVIEKGAALTYEPIYGSIYDVFGYKGHAFDADSTNENKKIYIKLVDMEGKRYVSKSGFKLGELDKLIDRHNAVAVGRWEREIKLKKANDDKYSNIMQ